MYAGWKEGFLFKIVTICYTLGFYQEINAAFPRLG